MKAYDSTKKRIIRHVVLLLPLIFLSACFKPSNRSAADLDRYAKGHEANATFVLRDFKATSVLRETNASFQTPESKFYNFGVCIHDRRTQDAVVGQTFVVSGADETTEVRTDNRGCLHWSEEIRFNFFAEPKYVHVNREIAAKGAHRGSRRLQLAINPWSKAGEQSEAVDLSQQEIPSAQIEEESATEQRLFGSDRNGGVPQRPISISEIEFDFKRDSGRGWFLSLVSAPCVWLSDVEGNRYSYALKDGKFRISGQLLASVARPQSQGNDQDQNRARTVLAKIQSSGPVRMRAGKLMFSQPLKLPYRPKEGRIELVLRIEPVDSPKGLGGFTGLFIVGESSSLNLSKSLRLRPLRANGAAVAGDSSDPDTSAGGGADVMSLSAMDATGVGASGADRSNVPTYLESTSAFRLEPLVASLGETLAETALWKEYQFRVKTCVSDPNEPGAVFENTPFTITTDIGKKLTAVAHGEKNCLVWLDSIEYDHYVPEKYLKRTYTVESPSGHKQTRSLVLNPWENGFALGSPFFFQQDLEIFGEEKLKEASRRQLPQPKLWIWNLTMTPIVQARFSLDPFLNMLITRRFTVRFQARVERTTLRLGRNVYEPLRDGYYLLKMALERDFPAPDGSAQEFLSIYRTLVAVKDGQVSAQGQFTFRDRRFMDYQNRLFVELAPVDERQINTTTLQPLDSSKSLEQLIVKERALAARTFFGVTIPDEISKTIELRPTDALKESACGPGTCDGVREEGVQASNQSRSKTTPFQGGLQHLANRNLNDLTRAAMEIERRYRQRMREEARLSEFAKRNNLEYLGLSQGDKDPADAERIAEVMRLEQMNRVLKGGGAINQFLHQINHIPMEARLKETMRPPEHPLKVPLREGVKYLRQLKKKILGEDGDASGSEPQRVTISQKDIKEWIEGRSLSKHEVARLCYWWMFEFINFPLGSSYSRKWDKASAVDLANECSMMNATSERSILSFPLLKPVRPFIIERKLHVSKILDFVVSKSEWMTYSVSSAFSLSRSQGRSDSVSGGFSPTDMLGEIPFVKDILSGVDFKIGRSYSKSQDISESSGVVSYINLAAESTPASIRLGRYEKCMVLRLNPVLVVELELMKRMEPLPDGEKTGNLSRGLLICTGEMEEKPAVIEESYHYFVQQIWDAVGLSKADPRNRRFMLGVRGEADKQRVLKQLRAEPQGGPSAVTADKVGLQAGSPVARVNQAYSAYLPTNSGMYTIPPSKQLVPAEDGSEFYLRDVGAEDTRPSPR